MLGMREISVTRNFQGYFSRTFQDQSDFPGLSKSWNFKQKNPGLSKTVQHAWEPGFFCFYGHTDKPTHRQSLRLRLIDLPAQHSGDQHMTTVK